MSAGVALGAGLLVGIPRLRSVGHRRKGDTDRADWGGSLRGRDARATSQRDDGNGRSGGHGPARHPRFPPKPSGRFRTIRGIVGPTGPRAPDRTRASGSPCNY